MRSFRLIPPCELMSKRNTAAPYWDDFVNKKQINMDHLKNAQNVVDELGHVDKEQISDGYHTFKELYEFRKVYNAALFNEWGQTMVTNPGWKDDKGPLKLPLHDVHKSWRHHDGELCFGGGWFIVVAVLPSGQISNHYPAQDWELFDIPSVEHAKYPFDGHTGADVMQRILSLYK